MQEEWMIRLIAVGFVLALATSAQAMPLAPVQQSDGITQVAYGCGPGRTRVRGVCVARTTVRQARRCVRWHGSACAGWRYYWDETEIWQEVVERRSRLPFQSTFHRRRGDRRCFPQRARPPHGRRFWNARKLSTTLSWFRVCAGRALDGRHRRLWPRSASLCDRNRHEVGRLSWLPLSFAQRPDCHV